MLIFHAVSSASKCNPPLSAWPLGFAALTFLAILCTFIPDNPAVASARLSINIILRTVIGHDENRRINGPKNKHHSWPQSVGIVIYER